MTTAEERSSSSPEERPPHERSSGGSGGSATAVDVPLPDAERATPPPPPVRPERSGRVSRIPRVRASSPRRTRVVVRKIGPLSVFKFSLLFYLCVMLIVLFALTIVYAALSAAGAVDSFERVLGEVFGTGRTSTGGAEPLEINGGVLFGWSLAGGLVLVGVWSLINVFVALMYNLITDIIGGVEVTLTGKPRT